MTLDDLDPRDVFAMLAMQGLLASPTPEGEEPMTYGDIVMTAYDIADLMLRRKRGEAL